MLRFSLRLLFTMATASVSLFLTQLFSTENTARNGQTVPYEEFNRTLPGYDIDPLQTEKTPIANGCGHWYDDVDYTPMIRAWLSGRKFRNSPHCSESLRPSNEFNAPNVTPVLIDVNDDSVDELAIQSQCSPTGNCDMDIFQKRGTHYRHIFTSQHGVQVFGKGKFKSNGYSDIWTRMHGSWSDGDQVVYRFNGRHYLPVACFNYEFDILHNGHARETPELTRIPCSRILAES